MAEKESRTEILNLRVTASERARIQATAARLGMTASEAVRAAMLIVERRIDKSAGTVGSKAAEAVIHQAEFVPYAYLVIAGAMSYDDAVKECADEIAEAATAQAEEAKRIKEALRYGTK